MVESGVGTRSGSLDVLDEIEATMKRLGDVGLKIASLLDVKRIGMPLSNFERDKLDELLAEEDRLRKQLKTLGGPDWESNRRWM